MRQKSKILLYIILGLVCISLLSLFIGYFKNKYITEGADFNNNKDNFAVSLNVITNNSNGLLDPFPNGTYILETSSGNYKSSMDFSMNQLAKINTFYAVDTSNNVSNRVVTIYPKKTTTTTTKSTKNTGDVIPNQFTLDISFNEMTYKLLLPAEQILNVSSVQTSPTDNSITPAPTTKPPSNANFIDGTNNLIITGIGSIYDKRKNNIGSVTMDNKDMNNQKTFLITMKNSDNINFNLNKIIITFTLPVPVLDKMPPMMDSKIIKQIPKLDPDTNYNLSLPTQTPTPSTAT